MLWYLHLCAVKHIRVVACTDAPVGKMEERPDGSGASTQVVLRPSVTVTDAGDIGRAEQQHRDAHQFCFVANSVNFPIEIEPTVGCTEK